MPVISKSALVPYSAQQMFDLVNDVESYSEFLPWCDSSRVIGQKGDEIRASIGIAWRGVHKEFATCNRVQQGKMIEIQLLEGPFRRLEGFWRFDNLGESACKVCLDLQFEFANKLLSMTIGPVFSQIANTLVDAFIKRAEQVYGRS